MTLTRSSRFIVVASILIILTVTAVIWGSGFGFRLISAYAAGSPKSSQQSAAVLIGDENLSGALQIRHINKNYIPATPTPTGTSWDIVAKTGDVNLTGMGINVSVNSTGQVAFVGQTAAGESVFVGDGTVPPRIVSFAAPQTTRIYGSTAMINNNNQVIAIDRVSGPSYVLRVWDANNPGAATTIATGSQAGPTTSYSAILAFPALNNNVDASSSSKVNTVFSGLLRTASPPNDQVLVTPNVIPVTQLSSTRNEIVLPTQRPMIADNGSILIRSGSTATSPIVLWNRTLTNTTGIASSSNFSALGRSPGISDDGKIVAFYGDLQAGNGLGLDPGKGIFAAINSGGNWTYKRIAGLRHNGYLDPGETYNDLNGNGQFDPSTEVDEGSIAGFFPDERTGVGNSGTVVFKATNQSSQNAVFTNQIQPSTPSAPASSPAALLVQGDTIDGLPSPIQDMVLYDPVSSRSDGSENHVALWISLQNSTQAVIRSAANPVIFIPGIGGSELVDGPNGDSLWLAPLSDRLRLTLYSNGNPSPLIDAADAMRYAFPLNTYAVYAPLLDYLTATGGYREYQVANIPSRRTTSGCDDAAQNNTDPRLRPNLFVFAYDWRKSNADNAIKLADYLGCIDKFWRGRKVDIVAHSMGGLLARRYILDHAAERKVDKLITIGSPWLGAPKALHVIETGEFIRKYKYGLAAGPEIKHIAPSLKGANELLPSLAYQTLGGERIFEEDGWDYNTNFINREFYNYDTVVDFLNSRYPHPDARPGAAGDSFHSHANSFGAQDDWRIDNTNVKYFHFYGVGSGNDTIKSVVAAPTLKCLFLNCFPFDYLEPRYGPGDETVPVLSASRISNLGNFNAPGVEPCRVASGIVEHTGMTENEVVQDGILTLLRGGAISPSSCAPSFRNDAALSSSPSYYLSLLGADSVVVSDTHGNSTALLAGDVKGTVPGVSTFYMGNNAEAIALPVSATEDYSVTFQTTGEPIAIKFIKGTDNVTPTDVIRYQDVNLPSGVAARLNVTATNGAENLRYDSDGNGTFDMEVIPTVVASGPDATDVSAPTITFSEKTQSGGPSQITIMAADSASGVHDVSYSTDGTNFQPYTGPLSLDRTQTPILYAFATDNVGNRTGRISYTLIAPPTAASVSISGRVMAANGHGIPRSSLRLTDSLGNTKLAISNAFGYYRFENITVGQAYVVSVNAKRYTFTPLLLNVGDELLNVDFVSSQ